MDNIRIFHGQLVTLKSGESDERFSVEGEVIVNLIMAAHFEAIKSRRKPQLCGLTIPVTPTLV